MTNKEKESILVVNKFLAFCKEDPHKLTTMRNYLNDKLAKVFDSKIEKSNNGSNYRPLLSS
jgi:hypothetical protein